MSTQQLTTEAMALPLAERVALAQSLWESIDTGLPDTHPSDAIQRSEELTTGTVVGRTREQVTQAVERAIRCA